MGLALVLAVVKPGYDPREHYLIHVPGEFEVTDRVPDDDMQFFRDLKL